MLCWLLSARFDDSTWLCRNWTKLRALESRTQWREAKLEAKRSGGISFRSFQLGETKRSIVSFIFFIDSCLFLSLKRFGKQNQRWTDTFSKFFTRERPRKNFWQEEQVEFSIKYFRLKHLQFSMQIFFFHQNQTLPFYADSWKMFQSRLCFSKNLWRPRSVQYPYTYSSSGKFEVEGREAIFGREFCFSAAQRVGRSVCWRNRCRRKRIPDHILPRCVRFSVYVTWSLLSKEVERRTGCEIVSPNRAKKNPASITKPILSRSDIIESKSSIIGGRLD